MQPNPQNLMKRIDLAKPPIGLYNTRDPEPYAPLVAPSPKGHTCFFSFYENWLRGETVHLTADLYGCGGCGHWLFGVETRTREDYLDFLVEGEGLKASKELMGKWWDRRKPSPPRHPHIMIGPLKPERYHELLTITFLVNPDQLSVLSIGAQYHNAPDDPLPVLAPFGSGCMQLLPLLERLERPQAVIGATDIAMRRFLPPDILAFTMTKPMFEQLCALDEKSFLYKPFWNNLRKARGLAGD